MDNSSSQSSVTQPRSLKYNKKSKGPNMKPLYICSMKYYFALQKDLINVQTILILSGKN